MRSIAALILILMSGPVAAAELRNCGEAEIGIASVSPGPNNANIRQFYEGRVVVLALDQEEPACCAFGVAFLLPSGDGRDEPAFVQCQAVIGYAGLDVAGAQAAYDPARGLTLTIPAREYVHDTGGSRETAPLVVTIDAGAGTIRIGE
ncbi:MAG: hypothetical protein H7X93_07655 [Sphingomonadaceae bacterium]|nr:hypothetical protein [Sphingomonadaceae bacterium]